MLDDSYHRLSFLEIFTSLLGKLAVFIRKIFHTPWLAAPEVYNDFSSRKMITPIYSEDLEHTCIAHSIKLPQNLISI
jgi:hypothetical protein